MKGSRQVNVPEQERWIYGVHAVERRLRVDPASIRQLLIASSRSIRRSTLIDLAERAGITVQTTDEERLRRCAEGDAHQGVVAQTAAYGYAGLESLRQNRRPLLALDQVHDPNNFGALLRTAVAVGMGGVVIPARGAVGVTAAVEKAAAGAVNDMAICRVVNMTRALHDLKKHGFWSVALAARGGESIFRVALPEPLVLVLGGESGLRPLVQRECDLLATIPQPGPVESLNASVAGALAMYEVLRRRQ